MQDSFVARVKPNKALVVRLVSPRSDRRGTQRRAAVIGTPAARAFLHPEENGGRCDAVVSFRTGDVSSHRRAPLPFAGFKTDRGVLRLTLSLIRAIGKTRCVGGWPHQATTAASLPDCFQRATSLIHRRSNGRCHVGLGQQ